jgi:hypothetical protein
VIASFATTPTISLGASIFFSPATGRSRAVRSIRLARDAAERSAGARSAISRGAIEDPDEATFCLDCGHFVRRDRRFGTLVGSSAVDE